MNREKGVDFVIVSCYGENKIDYTKYNVESINRYWKSIEHTIYITVNYYNKDREINAHKEVFKNQDNVVILEGVDQSATPIHHSHGGITHSVVRVGLIDGCEIGSGGYYGSDGTNIGVKEGNREYVCVLDQRCYFLGFSRNRVIETIGYI